MFGFRRDRARAEAETCFGRPPTAHAAPIPCRKDLREISFGLTAYSPLLLRKHLVQKQFLRPRNANRRLHLTGSEKEIAIFYEMLYTGHDGKIQHDSDQDPNDDSHTPIVVAHKRCSVEIARVG